MNYTLHKDIPVPLYYQLKLQILADIREGRLKVGDMIQPECDLCRQLGVSRPTVRQALRARERLWRCPLRARWTRGSFRACRAFMTK